jgi:hypothetical protein
LNLKVVFDRVLELPTTPDTVLIFSGMDFDRVGQVPQQLMYNFDSIKQKFALVGRAKLPNIVFWNVRGKDGSASRRMPANDDEFNVFLASGFNDVDLRSVLKEESSTPLQSMLKKFSSDPHFGGLIAV